MYARAWARRAWIEHGNGLLKEHVGVLSSKVHAATVMMNRIKKARMCNATDDTRLVWVDLEMTGLDVDTDHILEMACLVTDEDLTIVAEGPNLIIHQPEEILTGMNDWCKEHHGKSGLTQAVHNSKISLQQAEMEMVSFVRQHTPQGRCPLAGNTVHADKRFLDKYMPHFMNHLHYRIVDVSTIKELCRRWYPQEYRHAPSKAGSHRALDDIRESIKELEYYRKAVFKPAESNHQSNCT